MVPNAGRALGILWPWSTLQSIPPHVNDDTGDSLLVSTLVFWIEFNFNAGLLYLSLSLSLVIYLVSGKVLLREKGREYYTFPATRLMQVLLRHPLAAPRSRSSRIHVPMSTKTKRKSSRII